MADKLKLEVLLSLVNKVTAPLKAITKESSATAKALKAAKAHLRGLEQQQGQMSAFRNLSKDASITANQLKATQASIKQLSQEIKASDAPSKAMTKQLESLKRKGSELKQSHDEIIQKQHALRASMAENGISTANFNQHQQTLKSNMAAATAEVDKQTRAMERQNKTQQAMRAARAEYDRGIEMRNKIAGAGATTMAAGVAMGAPLIKGVRDFATLEDARIGLAKQFDGAYDNQERLTKEFLDFEKILMRLGEKNIPLTTIELYALAEGAARMGVKGADDLARFTEQAGIMQAAFDLPADDIAMDMGKIAALYKIPISEIRELGDTINWLDDNAQSQGGDIIKVLQRVAGIATTAGMNFRDAAAFGSTFLSLGATEETAATATNAMIRELGIARMQPKRFQEGMAMVGLDSDVIQTSMSKDATGTIIKVLDALKTLPQEQQLEAATRLFGKEYGDDASKLAQNIGELRRQLKLANDEEARGSMLRESQRRNQSLSSQWEMTKNAIFNTDSSLSENLKPALIDIMVTIRDVTAALREWTAEHPVLTAYLVKGAAAIAIVTVGVGALLLAIATLMGPLLLVRLGLTMLGTGSSASAAGGLTKVTKGAGIARVGIMRLLGAVGALWTAFEVGYAIGGKLNEMLDKVATWVNGGKSASLGTLVYDIVHGDGPKGGAATKGGLSGRVRKVQPVSAVGTTQVTNNSSTQVTVHAAPGMSEEQVGKHVARELDKRERSGLSRRRSRLSDRD